MFCHLEITQKEQVIGNIFLPTIEIKDYDGMISGQTFFWSISKNDLKTYDNIRKLATGQGDDYPTGYLLGYVCLKNYYQMIAIDLSKQQALDVDPKAMQKTNFTGNTDQAENTSIFFIIEEAKETVLNSSEGTVKIL